MNLEEEGNIVSCQDVDGAGRCEKIGAVAAMKKSAKN